MRSSNLWCLLAMPCIIGIAGIGCRREEKLTRNLSAQQAAILNHAISDLRKKLPQMEGDELISSLRIDGTVNEHERLDVLIAMNTNDMIRTELIRRGDAIRATLQAHLSDRTGIYTGPSGQILSIGMVCSELIANDESESDQGN